MDARHGQFESPTPHADILQRLIDGASRQVTIPAGHYLLSDSLRLRSNLQITADGPVILEKRPSVCSRLIDIVGYGHSEFRVAEPHLFHPGMGICIANGQSAGFGATVARIVDQEGDTFFIDTPFHRDYRPREGAMVWSMFPIIAGYDVQNVRISGITLDGGRDDQGYLDGCRGGGAYLLGCRDIELDQLEIRHYRGDAISFQQCVDVWVRGCHLHDNAGHGLHPGSGSVRYVMAENRIHGNGGNGIFYCLRTTHSICRENQIYGNAAEGISIGERDTDHLIEANDIRDNKRAGLAFRAPQIEGADRVVVRGNTFAANGEPPAAVDLLIGPRLNDIHILDNQFDSATATPIRIDEACNRIALAGNAHGGRPLTADAVAAGSRLEWTAPTVSLAVGPEALDLSAARHLRIQALEPWRDRTESAADAPSQARELATATATY